MSLYSREADLLDKGFGPYPVTTLIHSTIKLNDGVDIAFKAWLPFIDDIDDHFPDSPSELYCEAQSNPAVNETRFPGVLEYLPYRKGDYTAPRDHLRHPWLASHGYVVIRADMRGSGDSTGFIDDEYDIQEQNDAVEIIGKEFNFKMCPLNS